MTRGASGEGGGDALEGIGSASDEADWGSGLETMVA